MHVFYIARYVFNSCMLVWIGIVETKESFIMRYVYILCTRTAKLTSVAYLCGYIRMLHWFPCNSVRMFHDGDVTVARGEAECNSDSPKWNISDLLHENQCSILFVIW